MSTSSNAQTARVAFALAFLLIVAYVGWWASLRHPIKRMARPEPIIGFSSETVNLPIPFSASTIDLNGDGEEERVNSEQGMRLEDIESLNDQDVLTNRQVTVLINGQSFPVPTRNVNPEGNIYLVQPYTDNPERLIAIPYDGPSGDPTVVFMRLSGSDLVSVGELPGSLSDMQWDGQGNVVTIERATMLDTWFFHIVYHLPRQGEDFERIARPFYERINAPNIVRAKADIRLDGDSTGLEDGRIPPLVIRKGSLLRILGCDNVDSCLVETMHGKMGWFNASLVADRLEGLSMAD